MRLVNLRINLILLSGLWIVSTLFVLFSLGSVSLEEAETAPLVPDPLISEEAQIIWR